MGYSLHLFRFRDEDAVAIDVAGVLDHLRPHSDGREDQPGEVNVVFPDGDEATVRVDDHGISISRPPVPIRDLLYELAVKFDLVAMFAGAGNDVPAVMVREERREHLPPEWREEAFVAKDGSDILEYY